MCMHMHVYEHMLVCVHTWLYVHLGQRAFVARISARILNSQCSKIGSLQVANTILDAIG